VLVVVAALLKCAQLPFHGWLIQVMEAPTPVSALLHAGVVNLGGFVLIRLHPLLADAPVALTLLGTVGAATAALAALVMTTRISIKVALAWSTAAQMGFMLVQIALGLPGMALLHLLAHSLYKAHAFLAAGGAVRRLQLRQIAPAPRPATATRWAAAAAGGLALTALAGWLWGVPASAEPALWLSAAIVALALVPLWLGAPVAGGGARVAVRWAALAALPLAYFGLHAAMSVVMGASTASAPPALLVGAVVLAFAGLYALQAVLSLVPQGRLARHLYPWFFGGLFLDEAVSRAAFRAFPPQPSTARQPPASPATHGAHA
jgi:NAD(P)H-quinone oxidoreductase subunit 5